MGLTQLFKKMQDSVQCSSNWQADPKIHREMQDRDSK